MSQVWTSYLAYACEPAHGYHNLPQKVHYNFFATATYHWLIFLKDIGLIEQNLSALLGLSLPPPFNLGYQFELAGVGEEWHLDKWTN